MTTFHVLNGYAANLAHAEQMAGLLSEAKFSLVNTIEEADVVIFNTCTTKSQKNDFAEQLAKIKTEHPYKMVIITGCMAQVDKQKLKQYSLVANNQIHNIVQVVEEALHDNALHLLSNDEILPYNLPRVRINPRVGVLSISHGCVGGCVPKTKKGQVNVTSYPLADIVLEAKKAAREGVLEIWLTAPDTISYGLEIGTDLTALLEQLLQIHGDFKIRLGRGSADHIAKISPKLVEQYKNPKMFKYLHLPLQAGHDQTLKAMQRSYTVEEYVQAINLFKREIPEINIVTDIVVGHPAETEDHYWGTLEVVRKITPDSINIIPFSDSSQEELPEEVVAHRAKVLKDIHHNVSKLQNERWLDWIGEIVIDGKNKEGAWTGHNDSYKQIVVEGEFKAGERLKVQIVKAETFDLRAKVLE